MSNNYIETDTPLLVTSFAYTRCGVPERVYWIVKYEQSDLFLKRVMKATCKSSWTPKLKNAALFNSPQQARRLMLTIFSNVKLDY